MDAIICELEPLPGVFDAEQALAPGAPRVGPERDDGRHPNYLDLHIVRQGDPLAVLAESEVTIERRYTVAHQEHAYIETEGALAIPTPDGGITVYSSMQSPFINHSNLMRALGLPATMVRVIQPPVGGSFGGKDDLNYELSAQASALALKAKRPVRITLPAKRA